MSNSEYKRVVPFNDDIFLYNACGIITITKENYPSFELDQINKRFYDYFMSMLNDGIIREFYFIYHNENDDNRHIHYIVKCLKQTRITTLCNKLSSYTYVNQKVISIDKLVSLKEMIDYFQHNDTDKIHYDFDKIIASCSLEELQATIQDYDNSTSIEYFLEICFTSKNIVEVMKKVGLKVYHKYRYEIRDLYEYSRQYAGDYEKAKINSQDLPFD